MSDISYLGTVINPSATIHVIAGEKIEDAHLKAVTLKDGGAFLAGAGENVMGIIPPTEDSVIEEGAEFDIQVKEMGKWRTGTGADIKAGDELTSDADGKAVLAQTGNFITAVALESTDMADSFLMVQIVKSGYMK